jgi:prophage regulatory protein
MTTSQIICLPAVLDMLSVSKPTIYNWIKRGTFPAPLKIGPKASGWLLAEIEAWIAEHVTKRGAVATIAKDEDAPRRDLRQRRGSAARRIEMLHLCIDSEFDELCGSNGVAPPRSTIAYPQRCAGAE